MQLYPLGQQVTPPGQHVAFGPGQQPQFDEFIRQHVSSTGHAVVLLQTVDHAPPPPDSGPIGFGWLGFGG